MHLNREHVRTSSDPVPPAAVAPAGGGGRIDRLVAKAASYSGKAKVVGWHCRRAKVRSQFPARGLRAESAAGVTGDPRDRTNRSWHWSGSMRKQGAKGYRSRGKEKRTGIGLTCQQILCRCVSSRLKLKVVVRDRCKRFRLLLMSFKGDRARFRGIFLVSFVHAFATDWNCWEVFRKKYIIYL